MLLTQENAQSVFADSNKAIFLFFFDDNEDCLQAKNAFETAISDNNEYITPVLCNLQDQIGYVVAQQVGVMSIPTLVVVKDKQPADYIEGGDAIVQNLQSVINKFSPSESETLIHEAVALLAKGDKTQACQKAAKAYELEPSNLTIKAMYVRILIELKDTKKARELLEKAGREEKESSDYESLMSALVLAEQSQNSPELALLKEQYEKDKSDDNAIKYAVALSNAGKNDEALELLFAILKQDLGRENVKKTFIDILNTLSDTRLQNSYRRKLYTLMY